MSLPEGKSVFFRPPQKQGLWKTGLITKNNSKILLALYDEALLRRNYSMEASVNRQFKYWILQFTIPTSVLWLFHWKVGMFLFRIRGLWPPEKYESLYL